LLRWESRVWWEADRSAWDAVVVVWNVVVWLRCLCLSSVFDRRRGRVGFACRVSLSALLFLPSLSIFGSSAISSSLGVLFRRHSRDPQTEGTERREASSKSLFPSEMAFMAVFCNTSPFSLPPVVPVVPRDESSSVRSSIHSPGVKL